MYHVKEDFELNLFTLSKRRMWDDLIAVFEIFKDFDISAEDYFTVDQSNIKTKQFQDSL